MHDHVETVGDDATREGVGAMIRKRADRFLQNHIYSRVNGVAVSDNFEAIRGSSDTIAALLRVTDEGVDSINNEAIQKVLATFNHESQRAEEYVRPPNEVLREGYEHAMKEKFASVIKEMKTTGEMNSLVVIERDYINHLSEEFREAHRTSCVGKQLFMKKTNGTTIYVLMIVSYHVIAVARIHKQSTRINNIVPLKTPKRISFQFICSVDTVYLTICNNLVANDTIILTNDTKWYSIKLLLPVFQQNC
jgi:hypothetical protein